MLGPATGAIVGNGHLLYRDAVSTPRSHVTDTTLGIGGAPPRAVPQDWFLAVTGELVDGGIMVAVLLFAALMFAGVGYGRLAARLVPDAGRSGAVIACVVAVWNPFVSERLLQGHWSLLVSYAALGWLIVATIEVVERRSAFSVLMLVALMACAGFTPTGSVLAAIIVIVVLIALRAQVGDWLITGAAWVIRALPWLVAALMSGSSGGSTAAGVDAFGLRAEPGLGTPGTIAGLGGIWNADAVPASRTLWWATAATLLLLVLIVAGAVQLWRHRSGSSPVVAGLAALACLTFVVLTLSATDFGEAVLTTIVESVPGGGLLRDTQKYVALMMGFFAVAAAAAVVAMRRWVPAGFAVAAGLLLVVGPLPDLAWGAGGKLTTVDYPAAFTEVAEFIGPDTGAVALYPPGPVRDYPFTDGLSLDPLPRMLDAEVLDSGRLTVDGVEVDAPAGRAAQVDAILAGSDADAPARLADLGVGWIIVESTAQPTALDDAQPVLVTDGLIVYRIDGALTDQGSSSAARISAWSAHGIWLAAIVAGAVAAVARGAAKPNRQRS